jgi:hypothetical protein
MADEEIKEADKVIGQQTQEITFKCPSCHKYKSLEEMTMVTRFFPILIVCRECEKEMR